MADYDVNIYECWLSGILVITRIPEVVLFVTLGVMQEIDSRGNDK